MSEPIRKITLKNGAVRYRLVVDTGRDEQGRRQQLTRTFDRLKDARGELARIRHETDQGTYVRPSEETVERLPGRVPQGRDPWPPRIHPAQLRRCIPAGP